MVKRCAIKTDLFADQYNKQMFDKLGDSADEVDRVAPLPISTQGERPPFPTETMVRTLVLKWFYKLSDEQTEVP